jgi:hypothetical protein
MKMSTRSDIIVQRSNGQWARVYCHFDGYPAHHGPILTQHYNSQERAETLVSLGDISVLDKRCDLPTEPVPRTYYNREIKKMPASSVHTFDDPAEGFTLYYGRDRGETGTEPHLFDNLSAAWPPEDSWTEFVYVWTDGQWWIGDPDQGSQTVRPLQDVVDGKIDTPATAIKALGMIIGYHRSAAQADSSPAS